MGLSQDCWRENATLFRKICEGVIVGVRSASLSRKHPVPAASRPMKYSILKQIRMLISLQLQQHAIGMQFFERKKGRGLRVLRRSSRQRLRLSNHKVHRGPLEVRRVAVAGEQLADLYSHFRADAFFFCPVYRR